MTRRVAAAVLTPPTWTPPGLDPRAWRIALAEDLLDVLALMAEVEPAIVVETPDLWLRSEVGWPGLPWYAAQSARLPDLLRAVAGAPVPTAGQSPVAPPDADPGPSPAGPSLVSPSGTAPGPLLAGPPDAAPGPSLVSPSGTAPGPLLAGPPDAAPGRSAEPAAADPPDQVALIAGDAPDLPGLVIAKLLRPLTTRPFAAAPATDGPGLLGVASRLPAPDWLPDADLESLDVLAIRRAAPQLADVVSTAGWHRLRRPEVLAGLDPRLEGWDATRILLNI